MPIATLSVDQKIVSFLEGDSLLQSYLSGGVPIYNKEVPEDTPDPYITINLYTSNDANANDGEHIFTMNQYEVVVRGKNIGFLGLLENIANRFDYLMRKTPSGIFNNTYIGHFMRENIIQTQDRDEDDTWYNLGGIYRCMAHGVT